VPSFRQILEPRPAGPSEDDVPHSARSRNGLAGRRIRGVGRTVALFRRAPELGGLIGLAAVLNMWALGQNGWANTYYSAAVRSMSTNWHDFLYGSLDQSGVMTVDKPPLALWVQALSVRVFGYHPLSILVPDALIGVVTVVLLYDLVRRLFGRFAGFVAGLALATTPITVAMSRHNNPDALLALCAVAALWFVVRAFEDGRTRWIVWAGVMVGLGFETKMGVALVVVPGIVAAWLWVAPDGWRRAIRQLLAGGAAMLVVGGAWPLLMWLTPAGDRPWISGTSDNSIFSLIFGYNGLGRIDGQEGGPTGFGNRGVGVFAGSTGPLRLLNASLGGQDGWLLGAAIVGGLAILASTRLRRADKRTGWLIAVGGSFLVTAVIFSIAQGIFHPYYVSLLAPFVAALVGASVGQLAAGRLGPPFVAVLVIAAGVVCEIVVLGDYTGQLSWLVPVLIAVGAIAGVALLAICEPRIRTVALCAAIAALLIGPAIWAFDTLGYVTQGTFPSGGPAADDIAAGGGFGGGFGIAGAGGFAGGGGPPGGSGLNQGAGGAGASPQGAASSLFGNGGAGRAARTHGGFGGRGGFGGGGFGGRGGFGGGGFGFAGSSGVPTDVLSYTHDHGGGTIAVSSQGDAAEAIINDDANVAGIGGFSGRESDPTISWFADQVRSGHIRWVYETGAFGFSSPADGRAGATAVLDAAAKVCTAADTSSSSTLSDAIGSGSTLYDCAGKAAALEAPG
jgi:4-amino-4-deoxy-L-arabinose transferase-like glycosyltransferase